MNVNYAARSQTLGNSGEIPFLATKSMSPAPALHQLEAA